MSWESTIQGRSPLASGACCGPVTIPVDGQDPLDAHPSSPRAPHGHRRRTRSASPVRLLVCELFSACGKGPADPAGQIPGTSSMVEGGLQDSMTPLFDRRPSRSCHTEWVYQRDRGRDLFCAGVLWPVNPSVATISIPDWQAEMRVSGHCLTRSSNHPTRCPAAAMNRSRRGYGAVVLCDGGAQAPVAAGSHL